MADGSSSSLQTFRKTAVLTNGKLTKLYWDYPDPARNQDIDMASVISVWEGFRADIHDPKFLKSRGYRVIVDGVELKLE